MQTATARHEPRALSRELSEFLVEFSIGVHRFMMYPPGHPSLTPVVESVVVRLAELLRERPALHIGVAQRQLLIEDTATDQKHPVLSDLANRLHDHQLGALTLEIGATASEIAGLLEALARETERGGTPLGLLPEDALPRWAHVRLHRLGYERLELLAGEGGGGARGGWADALWLGLAQAALGEEEEEELDGGGLAARLEAHGAARERQARVAETLRRIPRELRERHDADSERLRRKVADFIAGLDADTLGRLVSMGDAAQRRDFLLDANQGLAVDSVVRILGAAAASEGQGISHSMTRMLSKLSVHAGQGDGPRRSQADTALRENVDALIRGWELSDPNPEAYTNVLDAMSRASPLFQGDGGEEDRISGAERLVEMALEVDAYGPIVARAVTDLAEEGGTGRMLEMIRAAPADSAAARSIRATLVSPGQFRHVLAEGKVDDEGLARLLEEMGVEAVEPLLDVLADSQNRSVRRRVFDALHGLGPTVGESAAARLEGSPWFVQRNMLALLQRVEEVPRTLDAMAYLRHEDPRVRREALPLALRTGNRERVLAAALSDPDERMVRMALADLHESVPDAVLPTLVNRVVRDAQRPEELRAAGVRLLEHTRSTLALNTLLELTTAGKTLLGKPRLAAATPEVLAALRALAVAWSERPEAADLLEQAAKSKDAGIRGAVHVTRSSLGGGDPS